jgi:20S proteasome subunit beta 4
MKGNEDKILDVDGSKMFAMAGDTGDRLNFCDYIKKNIKLYELRSGTRLTTHAAANYTRHELAEALRRDPKNTNLLLGGVDESGASLYYLDYLGTMHKMPFGAHGYASNFVLSLFDRHYKPDLTPQEGLQLAELCMLELQQRFLISQPDFFIKMIYKEDGKIQTKTIREVKPERGQEGYGQ